MRSPRDGETWEVRAARNQAMFRAVNERLQAGTDGGGEIIRIACECADQECAETIEISASEYARLREHPNRFAVLEGHVYPEVEDVVEASSGFVVVAKRGVAGEVASAASDRVSA